MRFIRRLMEIKEEQREWESRQTGIMMNINETITEILKELQGRKKNGKDKNKRNRTKVR